MGKKGQGKFGGRPGGSSPPEERARIGAELLANKRFRDAIEIFKPLLAFEARPEWKESLAAAYAGHAQNLADKGMVGEALVVWENRRRFCGKPLMEAPWFDWILKSKNGERELCAQISRMGPFSEADPALAKNLAWPLFFLSDHSFAAIRNVDPLIEMCRLARESWHHYERGEKEKAEETSGRIPFRSPYAAVRLLVRALQRIPDSPEEAREILSRCPSTYLDPVVEAARIALEPRHRQFSCLRGASGEAPRRLALALMGYSPDEAGFICDLLRPESRTPSGLFRILARPRSFLDPPFFDKILDRLLPYIDKKAMDAVGHLPWDRPEWVKRKVLAQHFQIVQKEDRAQAEWEAVARLLTREHGDGSNKEVAAIYRHLARNMRPPGKEREIPLDEEKVQWLKKSREFDPYHRETLIRLAEWMLKKNLAKEAGSLTKETLAAFPEDPEVLRLRIRALLLGREKSEIVRTADRLHQVDSRSPESRMYVSRGWQAGFYDQLKKGRLDRARDILGRAREIADPAFPLPERAREILLDLNRNSEESGESKGSRELRAFLEDPRFPLLASLVFELEIRQAGGDAPLKTGLKSPRITFTPRDLWDCVEKASFFSFSYDRKVIVEALGSLAPAFKKIVLGADFSSEQSFRTVEFLLDCDQVEVARSLLTAALKHHKGDPGLVLLKTRIDLLRSGKPISERQIETLTKAADRARRAGDQGLAARIDQWLENRIMSDEEAGEEADDEGGDAFIGDDDSLRVLRANLERLLDPMVRDMERIIPENVPENIGRPTQADVDILSQTFELMANEVCQGSLKNVASALQRVLGEKIFRTIEREVDGNPILLALNGLAMLKVLLRQATKMGVPPRQKGRR